jgi:hypothetical protein
MRYVLGVLLGLTISLSAHADILLTLEFQRTMTGNVPKMLPEAVRHQEGVVVVKLKGDRISIHGAPTNPNVPVDMTTLVDLKTGERYQLDNLAKTYHVQTREEQEQVAPMYLKSFEMQYGGAPPTTRPEAQPTGKKAELNGHEVEEFVADTPKVRYTYWVARDLQKYVPIVATKLMYAAGPIGVLATAWQPDPAKLPGIALRTIQEFRGEYTTLATTTIQSIKEVTLDPEDFAPPTDYKRITKPSLPTLR